MSVGSRRQRLDDIVRAGLMDAIAAHGPITSENVSSASKRITGQIVSSRWADLADAAVVERLHKRISMLKHGHTRTLEQNRALRERLASCSCPVREHHAVTVRREERSPYQWIGTCRCDRGIRCNSEADAVAFFVAQGCATEDQFEDVVGFTEALREELVAAAERDLMREAVDG